jgi:hypothetical protein
MERAALHQHPGGEQQRVAGQEEPDQQPALGEDDRHDAEQAEALDELRSVEPGGAQAVMTRRLLVRP